MKRIITLVTVALAVGVVLPGPAMAQTAKDLAGTWSNVSNVNVRQDGSRVEIFGPKGTGLAIFDANGRFAIINGKIMQEGQQFGLQVGNQTYQITLKTIEDGRVVLARRDQEIVVLLRRK